MCLKTQCDCTMISTIRIFTFGFQISGASSEKVDDVEMFSDVEHDLDLGHEGRQVVPVHRRVGHLDGDRQDVVAFTDPDRFSFELFYN